MGHINLNNWLYYINWCPIWVFLLGQSGHITIFDDENIGRGPEYYVQDVPGEGYRYVRDAIGVDTVIIGGAVAYNSSTGYTDARKGQVIG